MSVEMTNLPSGLAIKFIGQLPTSCDERMLGEIARPVFNGSFCAEGLSAQPVSSKVVIVNPQSEE